MFRKTLLPHLWGCSQSGWRHMTTSKTSVSPYQPSTSHIPNKPNLHQHIREHITHLQLQAISEFWLQTDTRTNPKIWPAKLNYTWRFQRFAMLHPVDKEAVIDFSDQPPSNAEVKKRVQPYLYFPSGSCWLVLWINLPSSPPSLFRWNVAPRPFGDKHCNHTLLDYKTLNVTLATYVRFTVIRDCSMWREWVRRGGCIGSWWGNRRERDHWWDLGVDGWIILGWISRRWDVGTWTGLCWPRIETGGGRLWVR